MLIVPFVCAEFHDRSGQAIYSIRPNQLMTIVTVPDAIRQDPLYDLLVADQSIRVPENGEELKRLENDPWAKSAAERVPAGNDPLAKSAAVRVPAENDSAAKTSNKKEKAEKTVKSQAAVKSVKAEPAYPAEQTAPAAATADSGLNFEKNGAHS